MPPSLETEDSEGPVHLWTTGRVLKQVTALYLYSFLCTAENTCRFLVFDKLSSAALYRHPHRHLDFYSDRFPEHLKADKELQFPNARLWDAFLSPKLNSWRTSNGPATHHSFSRRPLRRHLKNQRAQTLVSDAERTLGQLATGDQNLSQRASKHPSGEAWHALDFGSESDVHLAGITYRSHKERKKTYNIYDGDMVLSLVKILSQDLFFLSK